MRRYDVFPSLFSDMLISIFVLSNHFRTFPTVNPLSFSYALISTRSHIEQHCTHEKERGHANSKGVLSSALLTFTVLYQVIQLFRAIAFRPRTTLARVPLARDHHSRCCRQLRLKLVALRSLGAIAVQALEAKCWRPKPIIQ